MKTMLHFAHGNGFPSPCYRQMLMVVEKFFECQFIDKIGHDQDFPVTDNWDCLVHEVISSIEEQASKPVLAVGHSLGGVLSILAAIQRPELFKAVILLDSPLMGRFKSKVIHWSKKLGMIDLITPAYRTRGRRTHWQSREEVLHYLRSKTLFQHFTPACLQDYIDFGLKHDEHGYSLRFDRDIEYKIYRTMPHKLYEYEKKLPVPAALIYGQSSNIIDQFDVRYMKKYYNVKHYPIQGTHMFPMEHPEMAANLIVEAARDLGCQF